MSTPGAIMPNQTQRANYEVNVAALAAASASGNTPDFENLYAEGAHFFFNVTIAGGTSPSIVFSVDEKDPASGNYVSIIKTAAITAANNPNPARLAIGPGFPVVANQSASDFTPRTWRVSWVITGTSPAITATVGAAFAGGGSIG